MPKRFDYTASAQRFASRYPRLNYIITQINFWIVANVLLGTVIQLQALSIAETYRLSGLESWGTIIFITIILGILYGTILGSIDYSLDKKLFRKQPLGKIILLKTLITLCVLIPLFLFIRFVFLDLVNTLLNQKNVRKLNSNSWRHLFTLLLVYYFVMSLVINFINQVNKKYGPGILLPLLMGKYKNPREEERIFMFMDLQSSTALAEKLGHLKYSAFIRDCFSDINQVLSIFHAQVYQYVGDEIVLTWKTKEGLQEHSCIRFYFACENFFQSRSLYYYDHYGAVPFFKAGLHLGSVTAVEIGEVKRDIAYHGDTLNTAARIQSVCNEFNKKLLVSSRILERLPLSDPFNAQHLGLIQLKGKTTKIGIASIEHKK